MVTKTLTITEDSYNLLVQHKQEGESFSQEIGRLFTKKKKKTLMDFFGLLSDQEGEEILTTLKKHKDMEIKLHKKRILELYG